MIYEIKRGAATLFTGLVAGQRQEAIMGVDVVNATFTLNYYIDFLKGDTMLVNNELFTLSKPAEFKQDSKGKWTYNLNFLSEGYKLADTEMLGYDENNVLNEYDCFFTGTADKVMDFIIANANKDNPGWTKGVVDVTETFDFDFTGDNCTNALVKLADRAKTEFWIEGKKLHLTKKGAASGLSFRSGKGKGLLELNRKPLDNKPVTRLRVYGSKQNLPTTYPGMSKRLRMPNNQLFIQDQAKVDKYGLIPDTIIFEDIFPKRIGTVTAVGNALTFTDSSLDFDINLQLIDKVAAKVKFTTGQCAGYQFDIKENGYNHATKTITINVNKDEKAMEVPSATGLKPAVGDQYILIDIIMPQAYVTAAEIELKAKAQEKYIESVDPRIQFDAPTDRRYLREHNLFVKLGDFVNINEPKAGINKDIRVISKTTNLQDKYDVALELADSVSVANIVKQIIAQDAVQKAITNNKLNDIARVRNNWRTTQELSNMLDTLRAEMLLIMVDGGAYTSDIVSETTNLKFTTTAGVIQHEEYIENGGNWNVAASSHALSGGAKFAYIKASKGSTGATIILSNTKIGVEEVANFYHFPFGIISSVISGTRIFTSTKGYTRITGNNIQTGLLSSIDGLTGFDLDNSTIFGNIKFRSSAGVLKDIEQGLNEAQQSAKDYADEQLEGVNQDISDVAGSLNTLDEYVDGAFKDGIIQQSEAKAIEKYINSLTTEKSDIDFRFNAIHGNTQLPEAQKTNLNSAKTAYNTAHSNLISSINSAISDGKTTVMEKADVDAKFVSYKTAIGTLSTRFEESINAIAQAKADKSVENLNEYVSNTLPAELAAIQSQLDGAIESYFYGYNPTLTNIPAAEWNTNEIKETHLGDLFYNNISGDSFRFQKNGTSYEWLLLSDSGVSEALAKANLALDTADGKRTTFVDQPTTPYKRGDLWAQGPGGDLMRCNVARISGSFVAADWGKASDYTNDARAILAESNAKAYADSLKASIDAEVNDLFIELALLESDMNNAFKDGIISQAEAISIKNQIKVIDNEKSDVDNRYTTVYGNTQLTGTAKTELAAAKTAYNSSYTALINAINTAVSTGKINAAGIADVNAKFADYKTKIGALSVKFEAAVNFIAQAKATAAETSAKSYANGLIEGVNEDINDVNTRVDSLDEYIDGAFSDGLVSKTEAVAIEKYLNTIKTEKSDVDQRFTTIHGNTSLPAGAVKTDLAFKKGLFDTSFNVLTSSINTAISDGRTTATEKQDVDTKFAAYRLATSDLAGSFENAINLIAQTKANAAVDPINTYLEVILPTELSDLQAQIDGTIESFFFQYDPTTANAPANNWSTPELKAKHGNDTFTNTNTGQSWRWLLENGAWTWKVIADTATQQALALAGQAKDTADSKRRNFIVQPYSPYEEGDTWTQGAGGEIMRCITPRVTPGVFYIGDWEKASKYTDDAAVADLAGSLGELAYKQSVMDAMEDEAIMIGGYFKNSLIETINLYVQNLRTKITGKRVEILGEDNNISIKGDDGNNQILLDDDSAYEGGIYQTTSPPQIININTGEIQRNYIGMTNIGGVNYYRYHNVGPGISVGLSGSDAGGFSSMGRKGVNTSGVIKAGLNEDQQSTMSSAGFTTTGLTKTVNIEVSGTITAAGITGKTGYILISQTAGSNTYRGIKVQNGLIVGEGSYSVTDQPWGLV